MVWFLYSIILIMLMPLTSATWVMKRHKSYHLFLRAKTIRMEEWLKLNMPQIARSCGPFVANLYSHPNPFIANVIAPRVEFFITTLVLYGSYLAWGGLFIAPLIWYRRILMSPFMRPFWRRHEIIYKKAMWRLFWGF